MKVTKKKQSKTIKKVTKKISKKSENIILRYFKNLVQKLKRSSK